MESLGLLRTTYSRDGTRTQLLLKRHLYEVGDERRMPRGPEKRLNSPFPQLPRSPIETAPVLYDFGDTNGFPLAPFGVGIHLDSL